LIGEPAKCDDRSQTFSRRLGLDGSRGRHRSNRS
jgi:hypothetical protein